MKPSTNRTRSAAPKTFFVLRLGHSSLGISLFAHYFSTKDSAKKQSQLLQEGARLIKQRGVDPKTAYNDADHGAVATHYAEKAADVLRAEGFLLSAQDILEVFYLAACGIRARDVGKHLVIKQLKLVA